MGDLSPSGATLFRALIADKNAPFSATFRPPPAALIFTQHLGNPQMRLARKKGCHLGDTWIAHDFPKILEKSWKVNLSPSRETLFGP